DRTPTISTYPEAILVGLAGHRPADYLPENDGDQSAGRLRSPLQAYAQLISRRQAEPVKNYPDIQNTSQISRNPSRICPDTLSVRAARYFRTDLAPDPRTSPSGSSAIAFTYVS